jgi:uncharacterized phage protein gp47/JayE
VDLPTFADLFRIGEAEILSRNGALTRAVLERPGTDANALVASGAAVGDEVVGQLATTAAGLFLDSATASALDRLVFDRYGLLRKPAAPALGSVNFSTMAPAPAAFTINAGVVVSTADGIQYVTTTTVTFPMGSVGPVIVPIRSVLAGFAQQAKPATVTTIVSNIPGATSDIAVTNPLATSGAADAETDDLLRVRAQGFFTSVRRGTLNAITEAALAVPGVQTAVAFEVLDALGRPARYVQLVVSDAFTDALVGVSPTPPLYATQSQQLSLAVFNALFDVRPAGVFVQVSVASVVLQAVQLALTFIAGANVDLVALEARAAIIAYINGTSPGALLTTANMVNALRTVPGLIVTGSEIVSPAGSVQALPLQVLRSTLGLVTAVSMQPDRPLMRTTDPDAFVS